MVVAVVAALVLEPVRRTLVRLAERLAFGREVSRDELLLRLGETLERTLDRRALTESIAETAMEGLGAQWVRLELHDAAPVHVAARWPRARSRCCLGAAAARAREPRPDLVRPTGQGPTQVPVAHPAGALGPSGGDGAHQRPPGRGAGRPAE